MQIQTSQIENRPAGQKLRPGCRGDSVAWRQISLLVWEGRKNKTTTTNEKAK